MNTNPDQSGTYQTTAKRLRLLIPELLRQWQERWPIQNENGESAAQSALFSNAKLTNALPALLEQLAEAMTNGRPAETAVSDTTGPLMVPAQALEQTLQEYHRLQRLLIELLEAQAPLAQEARYYIEDALHAAQLQVVRAYATEEEQLTGNGERRLVRDSEQQLRALVDSNLLGVILTQLDGRILDANEAFLDLLGYSRAELSTGSLNWHRITPPEHNDLDEQCSSQVMMTGRCALYEKEYFRKDGSRVTVLVGKALTHRLRGECITYVLDRTHYKELESALRERAKEVEHANERLNHFLAMVAHELRTPLSTISNALYLLESFSLSDQAARQVAVAARQTRHAARLVSDLMDLSRISRGKIELRREPISLRRTAADAVESARPMMDSFGHQFIADLPSAPLLVDADPIRIEQIINNLLTNAAKYTEPGGIIRLSVRHRGEHTVLGDRDNGMGLDPDRLSRVFDLYEQFGLSETRSHGGLGIGLPLVRRLVELHGGTVCAHSEGLGKGSEFEISLPLWAGNPSP